MKLWTLGDLILWKIDRTGQRRVPAGSCLFVSGDQSAVPAGHLAIEGYGVADVVPISWLSFEPVLIFETV